MGNIIKELELQRDRFIAATKSAMARGNWQQALENYKKVKDLELWINELEGESNVK